MQGTAFSESAAVAAGWSAVHDLLIKSGFVFDAASGSFSRKDVAVRNGRIVPSIPEHEKSAVQVIDAEGLYVLPGLVDHHTHLFYGGSDLGVQEELACLPFGVTTAVDAGTTGSAGFAPFAQRMAGSMVRIRAQLNIAPEGISTFRHAEDVAPDLYDLPRLEQTLERYGDRIVGLKLRLGKEKGFHSGAAALEKTLETAERVGLPLTVHTTDPALPLADIATALRPGDVFAHVHQGMGETILDADGNVRSVFFEAQKRGVVFDAAKGVRNCSFAVARRALACGFEPDIISSDITSRALNMPSVFGLTHVLSAYLALGMSFEKVVAACTVRPARALGMEGRIGTLHPGACADVAIVALRPGRLKLIDSSGAVLEHDQLLVPRMTLRQGYPAFRAADF